MSNQAKKMKTNKAQLVFFVLLLILILGSFFVFPRIVVPFGIAYVLSLILKPVIRLFYTDSIERKIAGAFASIIGVVLLFYPFVELTKTITKESQRIDYYLPRLEAYLRNKYALFTEFLMNRFNYELSFNPVDQLIEFGQQSTKVVVAYLPKLLTSTLELSLLIPLFLYFILKDERSFRESFLKIVPNSFVERFYYLYYQFNTKFGDYIFAKFIEASIVGFIITIGLLIIDYPFPILLGLTAAITNILPYIGPIVGFVPALVIGLVDQSLAGVFPSMIFLYLIANIIDLAFVFPILVSKIVNLHPVIVVASVLIGSQFAGVAGMIISIPLAAFLQMLVQEIYYEIYKRS